MVVSGPAITIDANRIAGLGDLSRHADQRQRSVNVAFLADNTGLTSLPAGITDADAGVLGSIAALDLEKSGFATVGVFALAYWKTTKAASRHDNSNGVS